METYFSLKFLYLSFIYLFTGGRYEDGGDYTSEDDILIFDTETQEWKQLGVMNVARRRHGVSLVDYNSGDCQ